MISLEAPFSSFLLKFEHHSGAFALKFLVSSFNIRDFALVGLFLFLDVELVSIDKLISDLLKLLNFIVQSFFIFLQILDLLSHGSMVTHLVSLLELQSALELSVIFFEHLALLLEVPNLLGGILHLLFDLSLVLSLNGSEENVLA